jgi:hypothetical protein
MNHRQEVLTQPEFWASYYMSGLEVLSDREPDYGHLCALLSVDKAQAEAWWEKFTGWYPGIFDQSDGWVDDPATVSFRANGVELLTQFYPGDTVYLLKGIDQQEAVMFGIRGPHWRLPMLRWSEARSIAAQAEVPGDTPAGTGSSLAMLLLVPGVWISAGDDEKVVAQELQEAWRGSRLVDDEIARLLTNMWSDLASQAPKNRWWQTADCGWLTDAEHCFRWAREEPASVRSINCLISRMCGGTRKERR